MKEPLPVLIAGATGVGKSALALELAKRVAGEIISVDSMQVYRGLDIGTAKPGLHERAEVPHHLIDIRQLTESFDAAAFLREADAACQAIAARGHIPILCGGTGLYFKAWLEGLGNAPASSAELRAELETVPTAALLEELNRLDPITFQTIDRQNRRRVVRAIEVIRLTGNPFSAQRAIWNKEKRATFAVALERDPAELSLRIERRVDQMFATGLVDEARSLLAELRSNPIAAQAIGYRQLLEFFDKKRDLANTIEAIKIRTRQFAKRQRTWFKNQLNLEWILLDKSSNAEEIARGLERSYIRRTTKAD